MSPTTLSLGPGLFDRRTRQELNKLIWKLLPIQDRNNPAVWEQLRRVCVASSYGEVRDDLRRTCQGHRNGGQL